MTPDDYQAVVFHDNNCLDKQVKTYEDVERFIEDRFDDDLSRYHIFVNQDGSITMGESLHYETVYREKFEGPVISIYLVANLVKDDLSQDQEESLIALCVNLYDRFGIHEDNWVTHREIINRPDPRLGSRHCPEQNFPIEKVREYVRQERQSNERLEDNQENDRSSEGVEGLIETDSLRDTCDALRTINGRLKRHSKKYKDIHSFVEKIAV